MLAAKDVSADEALELIGIILVIACLAGAAYAAWLRNVVATVLLIVVAIVVAFLLL